MIRRLLHPILATVYNWYASIPHWYRYDGLRVKILPSVFHPAYFFSTQIMLEYVLRFELRNKSVLELGAGSGLISLVAAKKGAKVTATDINPEAISSIKLSLEKNQLELDVILSDMLELVPIKNYDYIIINPPYYPKLARNFREMAFFCGPNFEYFEKLFSQLSPYASDQNKVLMILSQDCKIDEISRIASPYGYQLCEVHRAKKNGEVNFIFEIIREIDSSTQTKTNLS